MYRKHFWFMRRRAFWQGRAAAKWLKYDRPAKDYWPRAGTAVFFAVTPGPAHHPLQEAGAWPRQRKPGIFKDDRVLWG